MRRLGRSRGFDLATAREAFRGPGQDTRQWVSYGLVGERTEDAEGAEVDPVQFVEGFGPLVNVILQPTNVPVRCRVASSVAGAGEGSYDPLITGDEVIVLLPEGDESAAPVIVGKVNNGIDTFPENVAGQDPSTNTFGFRRSLPPHIEEYGSTWMVRVATHGGFILLSDSGTWMLRDGASDVLQLGADGFSVQSQDGRFLLQLAFTDRRFTLMAGNALFTLSDDAAAPEVNALALPGAFSVSTVGNPAAEHVTTTEAVANLLVAFGALTVPPVTAAQVAIAVTAAAVAPLNPAVAAAIAGAFAVALQKPPGDPVLGTQLFPGIGCPGFVAG